MAEIRPVEQIKHTIGAATPTGQPTHSASLDEPAVGIVARRGDGDAVAGAILRADRAGYHAFVTYDPAHVEPETIEFAERLGAAVVRPELHWRGAETPRELLARTAREYGHPGIVVLSDAATRVDFEASADLLRTASTYAVEAVPAPTVTPPVEVLIGIPAYDAAPTVAGVVASAAEHGTVLVVDDGSDDGTATAARDAGATVVEHETNRGYGAALRTIFAEAAQCGAAHLVILDADGQHDPDDVPRLLDELRSSSADVVIASRFTGDAESAVPLYRTAGLAVVNWLTNASLEAVRPGADIRDTQSGFRAYGRAAIESLADDTTIGDGMSASTDVLHHAHRNGFAVAEVGTTVAYDVEGGNSQHPLTHGLDLVTNLALTLERDRPLLVLALPGLLALLAGIVAGYWTVWTIATAGTFPVGVAVLGTLLVLVGLSATATGLLVHSLNQHALARERAPTGG